MRKSTIVSPHRAAIAAAAVCIALAAAALVPVAAEEAGEGGRVDHIVDTPFYTLRGPEMPMIALIQTGEEVEYIGDYLGLDTERAGSALRLLEHVDFDENMLLVVNGGPVEAGMLRVDAVYEENGELHVDVAISEPPAQYLDGGFGSPASDVYYPSLVTVLPRFVGRLVVHTISGPWAAGGDLRGVFLLIDAPAGPEGEPDESGP